MPKLTQEQWIELLRVVDYYICDETIRLIDENAGDVEWQKLQEIKDIVTDIDFYLASVTLEEVTQED